MQVGSRYYYCKSDYKLRNTAILHAKIVAESRVYLNGHDRHILGHIFILVFPDLQFFKKLFRKLFINTFRNDQYLLQKKLQPCLISITRALFSWRTYLIQSTYSTVNSTTNSSRRFFIKKLQFFGKVVTNSFTYFHSLLSNKKSNLLFLSKYCTRGILSST